MKRSDVLLMLTWISEVHAGDQTREHVLNKIEKKLRQAAKA